MSLATLMGLLRILLSERHYVTKTHMYMLIAHFQLFDITHTHTHAHVHTHTRTHTQFV